MIFDQSPQGSPEWLAIRKGCITASRAKDARDRLKNGQHSAKALTYARDKARERCGGKAPEVYVNAAMREGTEQEPLARMRYEADTGRLIEEVGFAYTEDGKFGVSVDGLIGDDGVWECKTMVSSDTLFTAMVDGDVSAYIDQCNFALWLLGRKWVDLSLWCADLQVLHTIRIERNDDAIEALEADMLAFEKLVTQYETALRAKLSPAAPAPAAPTTPDMDAPWELPTAPVERPRALAPAEF
jgi:exodeoxyribonuclease (lambda-induced)